MTARLRPAGVASLVLVMCAAGARLDAATPALQSVSPGSLTQGSGSQNVTLTGSNFVSSNWHQLSVDGGSSWSWATVAPSVTSSTKMTVAVNKSVVRTVRIRVCLSNGSSACSGSVSVVITPAVTTPTLTSVSPTSLFMGSSSQNVVLNGANFTSSSWHQLSTNSGGSWSWATAAPLISDGFRMEVTINRSVAQTIWIRVCAFNGSTACSGSVSVVINPPVVTPTLTSVSPTALFVGSSSQNVVLNGANFTSSSWHQLSTDGGGSWSWATAAPLISDGFRMEVPISRSVARTIRIRVCASNGSSACSGSVSVVINGVSVQPSVSQITPSAVPYDTTTVLTVDGSGFQNGFAASVNGFSIASAGLQYISSNRVTVSVKMGGTSSGYTATLTITNPGGLSAARSFQVLPRSSLRLVDAAISPSTANAGAIVTLSYTINNPAVSAITVFLGASIFISGSSAAIDSPIYDRSVNVPNGTSSYTRSFKIPAGLAGGAYDVQWAIWNQSPANTSGLVNFAEIRRANQLTVRSAIIQPVLKALSISSATAAAGSTITMSYTVDNPNAVPATMVLGASINPTDTANSQDDAPNEVAVTVDAGESVRTRTFKIASTAKAVWHDVSGWFHETTNQIKYALLKKPRALNVTGNKRFSASITSPEAGTSFSTPSIQVRADVRSNVGTTIQSVVFKAKLDGALIEFGSSAQAPYQAEWTLPAGTKGQGIEFIIDVSDGIDLEKNAATVSVDYLERNVDTHWLPAQQRAYANQMALGAERGAKCGPASVAMMMAMTNMIAKDRRIIHQTANAVWPYVSVPNQGSSIEKMRDELNRLGNGDITFKWEISETLEESWNVLKQEIDSDQPVIVRAHEMTASGHFVVAVGYRQAGDVREIIAYDPFGRWNRSTWDPRTHDGGYPRGQANPDDENTDFGKWRYYDFPTIMTPNQYWLVRATSASLPALEATTAAVGDTDQDLVSDEIGQTMYYDGLTVTSLAFADSALATGDQIRAVHVAELRQRIDGVRIKYGLAPVSWTDPELTAGVTVVRAVHITELRTALAQAYAAAGVASPGYTDPATLTVIRVAHVLELRQALVTLELK